MDDAEAEAVLLALGAKLEWGNGFSKGPWCLLARGTDCIYMVTKMWLSLRRYEVQQITKAGAQNSHRYKTLSAVKAACERHHATGIWE